MWTKVLLSNRPSCNKSTPMNRICRFTFISRVLISYHRNYQIVEHTSDNETVLGSSRKLGGAVGSLIDGSGKNACVGWALNFRVRMFLKGAVMCPNYQDCHKVQIDWQLKRLGTWDGRIMEMRKSAWQKSNTQVNQTRFKYAFYCSLVFKDR